MAEPEGPPEPEVVTEEITGATADEVHRVGRPPGGRPTRPDLLVAEAPTPPGGVGRHHRGPSLGTRRPGRGARRLIAPTAIALVLTLIVGFFLYQWWDSATGAGLRLAAGTGRLGDSAFAVRTTGDGSNQVLLDLASDGSTVVAVGSDTTSPVPRPLFLYSGDDGATWRLARVRGSSTAIVQRVVGGSGLWLAFGGDSAGAERGLWTSTEGYNWTAVESSGLTAFHEAEVINDIARTATGFVAVGRANLRDGGSGPAAWISTDGRAWARVDSAQFGASTRIRELKAVTADGDKVVALAQPEENGSALLLHSTDGGKTWSSTVFPLAKVTPRAGSLAVVAGTFVLVPTRQRDGTPDVRVYCSANGANWDPCGAIRDLGTESPGIISIAAHNGGLVALNPADSYTVYTSPDGRTWTKRAPLDSPADATVRALAVTRSGTLVLAGDQAAAEVDNQLVLMTAAPGKKADRVALDGIAGLSRSSRETTRVAAFNGRYVAVGSAAGEAGIWTSANGQEWRPSSLGGPQRQELSDVAHGRKGWLAVGSTMPDPVSTDPLVVAAADDARAWRKTGGNDAFARADGQSSLTAEVVAAGPKGYVIAGRENRAVGTAGAVLWFTSDLVKYNRAKKLPQGGTGVVLYDLAATAKGYLAVGGSGAGDRESGVVWTSPDGVNWKARPRLIPPGATAAGLREVAVTGERIVAIGTATVSGGQQLFAAVSGDDGASWQIAWLPVEQAAAVYDLVATGQGLVAVGWHGAPGSGDSAAWTSADGLRWDRRDLSGESLGGEGMQWLGTVAVNGSDVLALGRSTTYQEDHLILWTSTLDG